MRRAGLVLAAAIGLSAAPAGAASVASGALIPPLGGQLRCLALNTSSVQRIVTFEVLDAGGTPIQSSEITLPQTSVGVLVGQDGRWCRWTFKGPKKTLRFSAESTDGSGVGLSAIEAR